MRIFSAMPHETGLLVLMSILPAGLLFVFTGSIVIACALGVIVGIWILRAIERSEDQRRERAAQPNSFLILADAERDQRLNRELRDAGIDPDTVSFR